MSTPSSVRSLRTVSLPPAYDSEYPAPPGYEEIAWYGEDVPIGLVRPLRFSAEAPPPSRWSNHPVSNDECMGHLKLMALFADLHKTISHQDGIFGMHDSDADAFGSVQCVPGCVNYSAKKRLSYLRKQRWLLYVSRAIDRFTAWHQGLTPPETWPTESGALTSAFVEQHEAAFFRSIHQRCEPFRWEKRHIPPIDVLMVWYSLYLNPPAYLASSIHNSRMAVWKSGFPWHLINPCIDDTTLQYALPEPEQEECFESMTGYAWTNEQDTSSKIVVCPNCSSTVAIPWAPSPTTTFISKGFKHNCHECGFDITRDSLRIARLRGDILALLKDDITLPGTLLSLGCRYGRARVVNREDSANRFVKRMAGWFLHQTDLTAKPAQTMRDIYIDFLTLRVRHSRPPSQASATATATAMGTGPTVVLRKLGTAADLQFHDFMHSYDGISSCYGVDLISEVAGRLDFIKQLQPQQRYLHSAALETRVAEAVQAYVRFVTAVRANAHKMLRVPSLDAQLVMDTHALQPQGFFVFFDYLRDFHRVQPRRERASGESGPSTDVHFM